MKGLFLIGMMVLNSAMAGECGQSKQASPFLLYDVAKYTCDTIDLESGQRILGGAYHVSTNDATGIASVSTISGFPPFSETVLFGLTINESKNYSGTTGTWKTEFRIGEDRSGLLTFRYTSPSMGERVERYECRYIGH